MDCGVWLELTKVDFLNIPSVIQRNTCKIHILNINLGLFDTRLKMNNNEIKKMLESRPEDALVKLDKLVKVYRLWRLCGDCDFSLFSISI